MPRRQITLANGFASESCETPFIFQAPKEYQSYTTGMPNYRKLFRSRRQPAPVLPSQSEHPSREGKLAS